MKNNPAPLMFLAAAILAAGCGDGSGTISGSSGDETHPFLHPAIEVSGFEEPEEIEPVVRSEEEWRERLTPEQFSVLRHEGTEQPGTSALLENASQGVYRCAGCDLPLFHSEHKYDSGTGWPSYWAPLHGEHLGTKIDRRFFRENTEVHCARCGGHLGHIFDDGPEPTGLRYCINGVALDFEELEPTKGPP